ncbi:uncharacterized protein F4812DRAFT_440182 [Daldinia caldariorum]|uniref:uncharacterized protein n=1 Tax=Daldinia caldariorum TaxID=326644 RepID=UPI00200891E6|nr:uncharacterized protein F4812DRAFT_440182 [Daldinia caldariorum]KAI1465232.1 hypothetical protein F4812DRAFT_440182 [Daldinia caldariorum]
MLILTDLPPEILRRVIEESMPEGFEKFMLTCRYVYECGRSLIDKHATYIRENRYLNFEGIADYVPIVTWMYSVVNDPVVARYVWHVDFCQRRRGPDAIYPRKRLNGDPVAMSRLREFIVESPYLRRAGVDREEWARVILSKVETLDTEERDKYFVFMGPFLFTLFPNLKSFMFSPPLSVRHAMEFPATSTRHLDYYPQAQRVMETITRMIEENADGASLGQLAQVWIRDLENNNEKMDLRALLSFFTAPDPKALYLTNCEDYGIGPIFLGYHRNSLDMSLGLRKLVLEHSYVDSEAISFLLSRTPYLESFRFSYVSKNNSRPALDRWDVAAFIAGIGKNVGQHLEELIVTLEYLDGHVTNGVTSMKEFVTLKRLDLDVRAFHTPAIQTWAKKVLPGEDVMREIPLEAFEAIPRLVKILPPSLEEVNLFADNDKYRYNPEIVKRLLDDFAVDRWTFLPNLEIFGLWCKFSGLKRQDKIDLWHYARSKRITCNFNFNDESAWKSFLASRCTTHHYLSPSPFPTIDVFANLTD